MNLDDFVRLPKEEVADKVQAFCDKFNDEGKKSSASNAMKALRSFLKANGFRVEELVLEDSYRAMKRPEYVPTKEEVCKMASVCGLKWRATILCLFQSGLRNSTLRALSYGMLKEQIESDVVPIKVHVTGELRKVVPDACKEGVDYWTFFGAEASEALRQYINWRKERYGKIDDDELLFPSESRTKPIEKRLRTPMDQWHLTRIVKKAARRAGIKEWQNIRAHSLRKTFRAVLDAGYIDGGQLAEDDKEYLMGHKLPGAKEPYHNANVDVLAQRYMKLRWAVEGAMSKEAKVEAIKAFARSLGIKEIEVKMAAAKKPNPI
jgi:integrase